MPPTQQYNNLSSFSNQTRKLNSMEIKRLIKTGNETASMTMLQAEKGYFLNILFKEHHYMIGFKDIQSCALCYEVADEQLIRDLAISFSLHENMFKLSICLN